MVVKEDWGLKKLAYPIQHKKSGFYHLFEYTVEGEVINALELEFRRDERFMRYLTVKLDKHAVAWAERRREKLGGYCEITGWILRENWVDAERELGGC